jgi:hypothetical protein
MSNHVLNKSRQNKRKRNKKNPLSQKIFEAEIKYRACGSKVWFKSHKTAQQSCVARAERMTISPYKCLYCDGYHVTTAKER